MAKHLRNVSFLFVALAAALVFIAPISAYADATISDTKESLCVGDTWQLSVSGAADDAVVTWTSSDDTVATVSSAGKVKAKKLGKATITATVGEETLTCKITVKTYAQSSESTVILMKGGTDVVYNNTGFKKITYKSSNKKVFKIASSSKKKAKLKGVKNGKAYLLVKAGGKTYVSTVKVATGKSYEKKWIAEIAKQSKTYYKSVKDRLFYTSVYVVQAFNKYGYVPYSKDLSQVISKKKGTCHSVGLVLAKIYNAMGYKAQVRSAIHDNMSRYPSGVVFGSDHYNVKVKAKGRTYYLDATPGNTGGMTYLSTSKKPLKYWAFGMEFDC